MFKYIIKMIKDLFNKKRCKYCNSTNVLWNWVIDDERVEFHHNCQNCRMCFKTKGRV